MVAQFASRANWDSVWLLATSTSPPTLNFVKFMNFTFTTPRQAIFVGRFNFLSSSVDLRFFLFSCQVRNSPLARPGTIARIWILTMRPLGLPFARPFWSAPSNAFRWNGVPLKACLSPPSAKRVTIAPNLEEKRSSVLLAIIARLVA